MERRQIEDKIRQLYRSLPGNETGPDSPFPGIPFWDEPIWGFADAGDPLFDRFREPGVIGPWFLKPCGWLDGARSVLSLFFPASEQVKKSNYETENGVSSVLWSYARIEGQQYIADFTAALRDWLSENGIAACVPCADPRFAAAKAGAGPAEWHVPEGYFGSNWSERHAAFVCGLGTFGLSKGLITRKGMAGRFTSLIFDLPVEPDVRAYNDVYEWCIRCGACARRCPAGAISLQEGKDHLLCAPNVGKSGLLLAPRYGCGLCQTRVPCESGIPGRTRD